MSEELHIKRDTNPITLTRFILQVSQARSRMRRSDFSELQERAQFKQASGNFAMLLQSIQLACKVIARATAKAGASSGLSNASIHPEPRLQALRSCTAWLATRECILGCTWTVLIVRLARRNSSGDTQKKLDVLANEIFINSLTFSEQVYVMVSEENDTPIIVDKNVRARCLSASVRVPF